MAQRERGTTKVLAAALHNDDAGDWRGDALCAETDPEAFFPEKGASTREAKQICARCPVRAECLDGAIERGEKFGIWGGLTTQQRQKLRARHYAEREAARRVERAAEAQQLFAAGHTRTEICRRLGTNYTVVSDLLGQEAA